jgi:hypothetical protein
MKEKLINSDNIISYRSKTNNVIDIVVYKPEEAFLNGKSGVIHPTRVQVIEQAMLRKGNEEKLKQNVVYDKTIYNDYHTLRKYFGISIPKPFWNERAEYAATKADRIANRLNKQSRKHNIPPLY